MKDLTFIAGPCAAETEGQVIETAKAVKHQLSGISGRIIFRAGIWKPRTQPDTFQGIGDEGLLWLQRVKKEIGLSTATEAATPEQVYKASRAGVDYLWIGARTSANPIAVQEIADTINSNQFKGVFIKNPVNNDVALWLGNIERMGKTGIPVSAIHRGCGHQPCWKMAYELRKRRPNTTLLLDPSHMSGDAGKIADLYHDACELEYDGVMVEVHPNPIQALSDQKQQITPEQLGKIINTDVNPNNQQTELKWLRHMIDEVDDHLWQTLQERMEICRQIGVWKKQAGVEVVQPSRFQEILQKRKKWARDAGLEEEMVEAIFNEIHKESVKVQNI